MGSSHSPTSRRRGAPSRSHTDSTAPAPEGRGLQWHAYGVPSPGLLARVDRGFARFCDARR